MYAFMQQNKWRPEAECAGMDPNLFFPPPYMGPEKTYEYEHIAISICKTCTAIDECLEYAVSEPALVTAGVWGGHTYQQIKNIRRRRKYKPHGRNKLDVV